MPNFKTHKYINYISLILITIFLLYYHIFNNLFFFFVLGFIIGTNYITPDLDINSTPSNHYIWYFYKKLSHHRGKTHALLFGFLLPIIYLISIILITIYLLGLIYHNSQLLSKFVELSSDITEIYYIYIIIFISGISVANGIHIILDKIL